MAHLYIADSLIETGVDSRVVLTGTEARHAAGVSRLRVGESVLLTNGRGLLVEAEAQSVSKDTIDFVVQSVHKVIAPSIDVTLVQALAKGDRDERAIEMATELGVSRIIPWQATRSVSRWDAQKAIKGRERWSSIVREASKQAIRAWIPSVEEVVTTAELVASDFDGLTMVLDPSGTISISAALTVSAAQAERGIRIVVGPEGGLAPEEVEALAKKGAAVIGLGDIIMRTSTAGPAAIAVVNEILRRW